MSSSELTISPGEKALAFWRMLHPTPSLITVLASGCFVLLAAKGLPPLDRLFQLLVIEAARQFSISAFNDYFDRDVDRGRPDKPVALGVIGPGVALAAGVAFGVLALGLSLPLGWRFTLLTAIGLVGGLLYDAGLKSTALSWLPFSLAFPTLPLWAWAGVYPNEPFPPQLLWVVPVGAVLVLSIHLADTIPDLTADTRAGVRGLAHRLGMKRSLALCWGSLVAAVLLTLVLWPLLHYEPAWYLTGLVAGGLLAVAGVALYISNPDYVKRMSLLLELGALALAVGWIGGITL
jgi:4-hydroxybenzoate polyprenyltransferase